MIRVRETHTCHIQEIAINFCSAYTVICTVASVAMVCIGGMCKIDIVFGRFDFIDDFPAHNLKFVTGQLTLTVLKKKMVTTICPKKSEKMEMAKMYRKMKSFRQIGQLQRRQQFARQQSPHQDHQLNRIPDTTNWFATSQIGRGIVKVLVNIHRTILTPIYVRTLCMDSLFWTIRN